MMRPLLLLSSAALVLAAASPAVAAEVFAGVAAHNADLGITACCSGERGTDVQFGIRSEPITKVLGGELRAYAMGSVNTDDGVSFAAAGLALRYPFGNGRFYVQPGLGAAVQDGPDDKYQKTPDRLYLGSRLLFEPEISVGWKVNERWGVEASYVHLSHAQLAGGQNPGMDDVGLRVTYRF